MPITRAALYVRYSSDNHSEPSIDDQFRLCHERVSQERREIVGSVPMRMRPYPVPVPSCSLCGTHSAASLRSCWPRRWIASAAIRLLYKQPKFAGVSIVTLAEGEISKLHVGLKGTMNALFLKDLAMKTHRGLRGGVEKSKAGGGLCYGYKIVKKFDASGEPLRGDREIIPEEAEMIRRIFHEFASGKSPKSIAVDLNREAIPARWAAHGETPASGDAAHAAPASTIAPLPATRSGRVRCPASRKSWCSRKRWLKPSAPMPKK